jgi:hypothetical protein
MALALILMYLLIQRWSYLRCLTELFHVLLSAKEEV